MTVRIAVAGIFHETNTFAPGRTLHKHFMEEQVVGLEAFLERYAGTRTSMGGVIDAARRHGVMLEPGLYTAAMPSGMVESNTADWLLDRLVDSIPADTSGLVLILHGAMVSEQYADFEGECLRRLRARLGERYPIAVTMDLHGNVSVEMAKLADFIVGYDTYPHIDMYERADEAFDLLMRFIGGEIAPARAYAHPGMLVVPQAMMTDAGSMKKLMDMAYTMEEDPRVLNVTVAGGFPYSDVHDAGMSFVVTTDGDAELAKGYAVQLANAAIEMKDQFGFAHVTPADAVAEALAAAAGPVILVEGSDNVGGGAPADATHVLKHLTDISQKALAVIKDEAAVLRAFAAGIGGLFEEGVGGKTDRLHGEPVYVKGKVRLLFDGRYRHIGPYMTGQIANMGKTAVVECGHLTLVLTERCAAPWDLGHIRSVGLWPEDFKIILVKSAIAWQTAFGPFAKHIIYVDSPGCCSANLHHFEYKRLRRPCYPLDNDPNPVFG
jgi:microcystin degradation protein MlrC